MGIVSGLLSLCGKTPFGLWLFFFSYMFRKMIRIWVSFWIESWYIFSKQCQTESSVCVCLGGLPVRCMSRVLLWTCLSSSDLACQTCLTQVSSTPITQGISQWQLCAASSSFSPFAFHHKLSSSSFFLWLSDSLLHMSTSLVTRPQMPQLHFCKDFFFMDFLSKWELN